MKNLPRLMLVTQRARMKPQFGSALEAALCGGAKLIQLREKDLPADQLFSLAQHAQTLCQNYGATLLINGAPDIALALDCGLHLPESASPLPDFQPCGVSVHSWESARRAAQNGADYLVFGSVFQTQSHPGEAPAGLEQLRAVCQRVDVPVFAIGGINSTKAASCFKAGAYGIAVIGAAWDGEVQSAVRHLVSLTSPPD